MELLLVAALASDPSITPNASDERRLVSPGKVAHLTEALEAFRVLALYFESSRVPKSNLDTLMNPSVIGVLFNFSI